MDDVSGAAVSSRDLVRLLSDFEFDIQVLSSTLQDDDVQYQRMQGAAPGPLDLAFQLQIRASAHL